MANLATLIAQKPAWVHLPTVAIRVPQKFKDQILDFAKALDSGAAISYADKAIADQLDLSKYSLEQLLALQTTLLGWINRASAATCDHSARGEVPDEL